MKKKLISYISNGLLVIGAVIGLYAFAKIYIIKNNLPAGVCPIIDNRPLMYTAIAFCCISFVLSLFETKVNINNR